MSSSAHEIAASSSIDVGDLTDPRLYLNREASLLEFNQRVLELAQDTELPLLERLRFLCICTTNLDEFFEIRVAGLKQQLEHGVDDAGADGLGPAAQLKRIETRAHELVEGQYRELNEVLLPALREEGIRVLKRREWDEAQAAWVKQHFDELVGPVLTPIGLDPSHPFPRVLNKSLNFIVSIEGDDAFGRESRVAIVQVPRSLPRVIPVGVEVSDAMAEGPITEAPGARSDFVLLSSVIHAHVGELFPGMKVTGCYQFRVTRNSDLFVDEEAADDLLSAVAGELLSRRYGDAVRLEVALDCPEKVREFLREQFELEPGDVYRVDGPVNLYRLDALHGLVDRPGLRFARFRPVVPRRVARGVSVLDALREGDLLLHHPYESFAPVLDMLHQAAEDPQVLAIKQTLYRVGAGSPVVEALVRAAEAGKEVTAVVELRARFDEARNIQMASRLAEAGANVVYGVVGYKCHAKLLLIVRREGDKIRRYCHLGTGNYHAGTARAYTDISYMTAREDIAADVHALFRQITGLGEVARTQHVIHAPFTLQPRLIEQIDGEIAAAKRGEPASIVARMNSLSDPKIIRALYRASQAGVQIDLLVRGICCLRPGVPGVSDNIRVRSVLGRFLEHSRVYRFENGGDPQVWCGSADWMGRNLYRRVEAAVRIDDPVLADRVVQEALSFFFEDNMRAWELDAGGTWTQVPRPDMGRREAQARLMARAASEGDA